VWKQAVSEWVGGRIISDPASALQLNSRLETPLLQICSLCEKLWWSNRSDNKSSSVLYLQHACTRSDPTFVAVRLHLHRCWIYLLPTAWCSTWHHCSSTADWSQSVASSEAQLSRCRSIDRSMDVKCIYMCVWSSTVIDRIYFQAKDLYRKIVVSKLVTGSCNEEAVRIDQSTACRSHTNYIFQSAQMSSAADRKELDARARSGETVVEGGTGGKSLEAQEHLAEGMTITCTWKCATTKTTRWCRNFFFFWVSWQSCEIFFCIKTCEVCVWIWKSCTS